MTDFRHMRCLRAYSGGTVPDSNRIHYSPSTLYEIDGTQMKYSLVVFKGITVKVNCQAASKKFLLAT